MARCRLTAIGLALILGACEAPPSLEQRAPAFAAGNTPARLAVAFSDLRGRNLDMSPIAIIAPQFTRQPEINRSGRLRLTGYFPTTPIRINFDLLYDAVKGRWRLFGISVKPTEAPKQPQSQSGPITLTGPKEDFAPLPKSKPVQPKQ